jgi:peptidyl-tRNA hydrolase, PTH1 family
MKLIVGLGNPDKEYASTRHNIGWMAADALTQELDFPAMKKEDKFKALTCVGTYNGEKIMIAKPVTYMNLSGESVEKIVQFYKIDLQDLFVIYDDLDLPLGQLRIRKEGSPGTHNGMKSLVQHLGSNIFPRFRIGIESRGETSPAQQDTSSFVLSPFWKEELETAKQSIQKTIQALKTALSEGLDTAMNRFNG